MYVASGPDGFTMVAVFDVKTKKEIRAKNPPCRNKSAHTTAY